MGFLDVAEDINEPAPIVGDIAGEFEVADGDAGDKQIVKITHIAGDDVPVKELEIVVRASDPSLDTTARLFDLPAEGQYMTDSIDGDKDLSDSRTSRAKIIEEGNSNTWETGDTIQFRINTGRGGVDFREGETPDADKLEIIIIHTPSNAIISKHTFRP